MSDWRPSARIEHLKQRAELLAQARAFFAERNVIEVQTPVLAKHTVTEPDVQSIEVPRYGYLQTSPEYQMKRLLAAGMPSCYQLGPAFRHGEQGRLHNPEFTMLEWYRLGFDHNLLMYEVADIVDNPSLPLHVSGGLVRVIVCHRAQCVGWACAVRSRRKQRRGRK